MKKYIKLKENGKRVNNLRVELYYSLGGYNYFTYREEPRGYYLSVSPVDYSNKNGIITEMYGAFSGIKECIKTVTRKSKKAEAEAETIAKVKETELINYVLAQNGLELEETERISA